MIVIRRLISNTSFSLLSNSIRIGTNLIIFIIIARVLTIENFGKITFSITFTTLFLYLASFGLNRLAILEISFNRTLCDIYFINGLVSKAILSLATLATAWLIINLMGYPPLTKQLVYLLSISVIIYSYIDYLYALFRGIEKLEYETIVTFINNLLLVISIILFLKLGYGVIGIALAFIFSRLLAFLIALGVYRFEVKKIAFHFDYQFCKEIFRKAIPFALLATLTAVLFDIDTILLSYLKGDQLVGYYQPAMKIIATLTVIPFVLEGSFLPFLSKLHNQNREFETVGRQLITILFFIGIPLMTGLIVLADNIIVLVYGERFLKSALALKILAPVLLLRFSMRGYEIILFSIGKQMTIFYVILFGAVVNIMLNICLIPSYGLVGSATSAALTQLLIFVSYISILKRARNTFMLERSIVIIFLLGFFAGILIYNLKTLNLMILIILYAICYLCLSFIFLKKERAYIFKEVYSFVKNRGYSS